jgi:riboflavin kinase/FMN adenylyltransferase
MPLAVLHSPEQWTARFGAGSRTALSVGNFDGLHQGHQKILRQVQARAHATSQLAAVVTFDPHPAKLLRPEQAPRMIQTLGQRLAGFEQMGLDAALVLRFDRALSLLSPEEFVQHILVERMHAAAILVGANFRFGHRSAGNVRLLSELGLRHGFDVEIVAPVELDGVVVSSSAVRSAIMEGRASDGARLLGRPFSLTGEIRPGAGRGRTILFPTLNLAPEQELLPKLGVYATESVLGGRVYRSVTNVGTRPTFNGEGVTVESHLFDFNERYTEMPLEVRFHTRLRDEVKFSSADQLKAQIARDITAAQQYFSQLREPQPSSHS